MTSPDVVERLRLFPEAYDILTRQEMRDAKGSWRSLIDQQTKALADIRASIPLVETQAGNAAIVDKLESALVEARRVVKSDADACRAFAGPGETSEPERVLGIIDQALATLRTNRGGGE